MFDLENRIWWNDIHHDLQELLKETELLVEKVADWKEQFADYSFLVFPAAKAYEGFLKDLFLKQGLISQEDYSGKRFRVGKALNPNLEKDFREKESVYDRVVNLCGGKELADVLWETWKQARNMVFHWFPKEINAISMPEAIERIKLVLNTMDKAYSGCQIRAKNTPSPVDVDR